jgi:hypothetical protein
MKASNFFSGNNPVGFSNRIFGKYPFQDNPPKTACCAQDKDSNEVFTVANLFHKGVLGNRFPIGKKDEGCCT